MTFRLDKVVEGLKGKTLKSLEYSDSNDPNDFRKEAIGLVIRKAILSTSDHGEDVGIRLSFNEMNSIFVYDNEEIEVE